MQQAVQLKKQLAMASAFATRRTISFGEFEPRSLWNNALAYCPTTTPLEPARVYPSSSFVVDSKGDVVNVTSLDGYEIAVARLGVVGLFDILDTLSDDEKSQLAAAAMAQVADSTLGAVHQLVGKTIRELSMFEFRR